MAEEHVETASDLVGDTERLIDALLKRIKALSEKASPDTKAKLSELIERGIRLERALSDSPPTIRQAMVIGSKAFGKSMFSERIAFQRVEGFAYPSGTFVHYKPMDTEEPNREPEPGLMMIGGQYQFDDSDYLNAIGVLLDQANESLDSFRREVAVTLPKEHSK